MALALPEAVAWPEDVEVVVVVLLRIETWRRPAPGAKKTQKTFHGRAALRSCHACQAGAWHSSLELCTLGCEVCTLGVGLDGTQAIVAVRSGGGPARSWRDVERDWTCSIAYEENALGDFDSTEETD